MQFCNFAIFDTLTDGNQKEKPYLCQLVTNNINVLMILISNQKKNAEKDSAVAEKSSEIRKEFDISVSHKCFLCISSRDPQEIQEMNRKAFEESTEDMYMVDEPKGTIWFKRDGKITPLPMHDIAFIKKTENACEILTAILRYMEGKPNNKPKDVIMPIRAAIDAGAIRKPTWAEFKQVFGENRIKQKSSLDDICNLGKNCYEGDPTFKIMVEEFKRIVS